MQKSKYLADTCCARICIAANRKQADLVRVLVRYLAYDARWSDRLDFNNFNCGSIASILNNRNNHKTKRFRNRRKSAADVNQKSKSEFEFETAYLPQLIALGECFRVLRQPANHLPRHSLHRRSIGGPHEDPRFGASGACD